jgi:hypothetical protein
MKNNNFYILLLFIFLLSCKKDEKHIREYSRDNIKAGENSGFLIISKDLNPDININFTYPNSKIIKAIDLNEDQTDDFKFEFFASVSPGHSYSLLRIIPLNNNLIAVINDSSLWAAKLDSLTMIDKNLNWKNDTCLLFHYFWSYSGTTSSSGLWNVANNQYIAFEIQQNQQIQYGWIKIDRYSEWNMFIKEFAYTNRVIDK